MNKLFVLSLCFYFASIQPAYADANADGKTFALEFNSSTLIPFGNSPNADGVPNYQGAGVAAQGYYHQGANIENTAQEQAYTNDTSRFIYDSRAGRPTITIQADDPLLKHIPEIQSNATALTDTYSDCTTLPTGDPNSVLSDLRTCDIRRELIDTTQLCHVTYEPRCSDDSAYEPPFTQDIVTQINIAAVHDYRATVLVDFKDGSYQIIDAVGDVVFAQEKVLTTQIDQVQACQDYSADIQYTDNTRNYNIAGLFENTTDAPILNVGPHLHLANQHPSCDNDLVGIYTLSTPSRTFPLGSVAIGYTFQYKLTFYTDCPLVFSELSGCPTDTDTTATLVSENCVFSGNRVIGNQTYHQDCWDYERTYTVSTVGNVQDDSCNALITQGCHYTGKRCLAIPEDPTDPTQPTSGVGIENEAQCAHEEVTYACGVPQGEQLVTLCGTSLYCPDGDCTNDIGREWESGQEDFQEVAVGTGAAESLASEFDAENYEFFTGESKQCKRKRFEFANCCSDSGWGVNSGLYQCDTEAEDLGYARQQDRAIYIGRYETGGAFDKTKHHVYCVYPSKMATIITREGKAQINEGYGTAREPDCGGMTPELMGQIDLNTIDFSSLYNDAMAGAGNAPAGADLATIIQQRLEERYGD